VESGALVAKTLLTGSKSTMLVLASILMLLTAWSLATCHASRPGPPADIVRPGNLKYFAGIISNEERSSCGLFIPEVLGGLGNSLAVEANDYTSKFFIAVGDVEVDLSVL
jgi:hypothetical protein